MDQTVHLIDQIMDNAKRMVLSTSLSGNSSAAAVFYARDGHDLVFFTFNNSRKAEQIKFNPKVQATIWPENEQGIRGIQIEGYCRQIKDAQEIQKAHRLLLQTTTAFESLMDDPFLNAKKVTGYYRLKPTRIKYIDFQSQQTFRWQEFPENQKTIFSDLIQALTSKVSLWLRAVRAPFFTATLVPVLLGSVIAYSDLHHLHAAGSWSWSVFLLILLGAIFSQAGTNLGNDYFDHTSHNDESNNQFSPFNGGSRIIQAGLLAPWKVFMGAVLCFLGTLAIGFYLNRMITGSFFAAGPLLWIGLVGVAIGFLYTGHPLRLGYHGWGEISIALGFGPLMVLGAHYVLTAPFYRAHNLPWEWQTPLLASIPVAILIMLVVWINQFQDLPADKKVGKKTWVVRLAGFKDNHVDYEKPFLYYMYFNYFSFGFILMLGLIGFIKPDLSTPFVLISLLPVILVRFAVKQGKEWLLLWNAPEADRRKLPYELLRVNVSTIGVHLFTGLLLVLGYWLQILVY